MNPFKKGNFVSFNPETAHFSFERIPLNQVFEITDISGDIITINRSKFNKWHYAWWIKNNSRKIKERLGIK